MSKRHEKELEQMRRTLAGAKAYLRGLETLRGAIPADPEGPTGQLEMQQRRNIEQLEIAIRKLEIML